MLRGPFVFPYGTMEAGQLAQTLVQVFDQAGKLLIQSPCR